MKTICIGPVQDGKAGGIDRYILSLYDHVPDQKCTFDFFSDADRAELRSVLRPGSGLFPVGTLSHPLRQYRAFCAAFREKRYDVAYFNISTALCFLGPLAAKRCGVPRIIIHSHAAGYDAANPIVRKGMTLLHRVCRQFLFRLGTAFYACSRTAGEWMFPPCVTRGERFRVIPNAIAAKSFAFSPGKRKEMRRIYALEDRFVIGHIGNFLYPKNHSFLLEVFAKVAECDPDATLLLVGDGPLLTAVQEQAKALGVSERVVFAGRHMNASDFLQAMDVFAFPSNFEGLGIAAVEAQAAGLPCLCSEFVPPETAITPLFCAVPISKPDSVSQWAAQILRQKNADRPDMQKVISDAGYDIDTIDFMEIL